MNVRFPRYGFVRVGHTRKFAGLRDHFRSTPKTCPKTMGCEFGRSVPEGEVGA